MTTIRVCIYNCIFVFLRGEKSMLWFLGESAWSLQLSGYSRLCRNSQLPWPDAGRRALFPEAFLRGGSTWGVHASQPDGSWKAYKMWWNPGRKTDCMGFGTFWHYCQLYCGGCLISCQWILWKAKYVIWNTGYHNHLLHNTSCVYTCTVPTVLVRIGVKVPEKQLH